MRDVKVACLGLAFKPDIDDLRESPAVAITRKVAELGCQVLAVEPNIEAMPGELLAINLSLTPLDEALSSADIACVLVKHKPFVQANQAIRNGRNVIDSVGLLA